MKDAPWWVLPRVPSSVAHIEALAARLGGRMDEFAQLEGRILALVDRAVSGRASSARITRELSLRRDLGLDSLALVALFFDLARSLDTDPDDLVEIVAEEPIATVGDLVALGARLTEGLCP
jgi:acyl carrier protein